MHVIQFGDTHAAPITQFNSVGTASVHLADGTGATHAYCLHFAPGGEIGTHVAGFGQLFLIVEGDAWAAGADGVRVPLRVGEGAVFERGELHSKGSVGGATVIMVQMEQMVAR